jgi:hypothetical protein
MNLQLISSLQNPQQRGGAYLRVSSIVEIYKRLGIEVEQIFTSSIRPRSSLKGILYSLFTLTNIRSLFTNTDIKIKDCEFLHLDNLCFFNWNIKGKRSLTIYNAHNLEHEIYAERGNSWAQSFLKSYEAKKMRQTDITFVCSQREAELMIGFDEQLKNKLFVLPNLVDAKRYKVSPEKDTILFLGTLDYFPNIQALDYLCNEFYPSISKNYRNHYKFVVAGRNPLPGLKERLDDLGVELKQDLSDQEIIELLARTKISLVPLISGSGTRLKIIESIFAGAYVLSTPLGSEGMSSKYIHQVELNEFKNEFERLVDKADGFAKENVENEFYLLNDLDTWFENNREKLEKMLKIDKNL